MAVDPKAWQAVALVLVSGSRSLRIVARTICSFGRRMERADAAKDP